jgi:hypothetical protein
VLTSATAFRMLGAVVRNQGDRFYGLAAHWADAALNEDFPPPDQRPRTLDQGVGRFSVVSLH